MKFKPLSVGTLPRVFVNLLALDDDGIVIFAEAVNECAEMKTWLITTKEGPIHGGEQHVEPFNVPGFTRYNLAKFFNSVLEMSAPSRGFFVKDFNRLLNSLECDDFFGTEGQCDPRGDHRD